MPTPEQPAAENRPERRQPVNSTMHAGRRKNTQRERLLSAAVHVCAEHGYANTTIAHIIARAGVSRPTFYKYFAGKDACFLAALDEIEARVLAETRLAVKRQPPEHAARTAIGGLLAFAAQEPAMARVLMSETLAGGPRTLDARDRTVTEIARLVERAYQRARPSTRLPDLSPEALVGGLFRLLGTRLGRGEEGLADLLEDLLAWVECYRTPLGEHRWRSLKPMPVPPRSPFLANTPLRAPAPLGPGRPRKSASSVAENHRQRILFATAEAVQRNGYLATTVADIMRLAGVDGRTFYRVFADKQEALLAVHEESFQQTMAVTAGAFFAAESWPQRIWEAGRAFTQHLEQNPTLIRASLIQSHAGAPGAVKRGQDLIGAFTIFLQEGYRYETHRPGPSTLALEAIAQANHEIIYRQARMSTQPEMAGLLAHLTHICLTPFVGAARAGELIEELRASADQP